MNQNFIKQFAKIGLFILLMIALLFSATSSDTAFASDDECINSMSRSGTVFADDDDDDYDDDNDDDDDVDDDDDDDDDPINYVIGQAIVKLDVLSGATINDINVAYGTMTLDALPTVSIYLLQIPLGADTELVVNSLQNDPRLLFAEVNYISATPEASGQDVWGWGQDVWAWGGSDSTPLNDQYASAMLGLDQAHTMSQGQGVVVAVLDTGVQLDHPALINSLASTQVDFIDGDMIPADEFNGLDDNGNGRIDEGAGHGTHVAGIIHQTAPAAQIMPVRILDSDGRGDLFKLIGGMSYAIDNGADIINLSLGVPESSDILDLMIDQATQQNIIVVAATGNFGSSIEQYPAANQCALGISSIGPTSEKSIFSNYGDWVAFAVPGESIYSTYPTSGYAWWGGTSMAAPFVAGQAALLRSLDNSLDTWSVAQIAAATAHPLDATNPGYTGELGAGLIDVAASLQYFLTNGLPPVDYDVISSNCVMGN